MLTLTQYPHANGYGCTREMGAVRDAQATNEVYARHKDLEVVGVSPGKFGGTWLKFWGLERGYGNGEVGSGTSLALERDRRAGMDRHARGIEQGLDLDHADCGVMDPSMRPLRAGPLCEMGTDFNNEREWLASASLRSFAASRGIHSHIAVRRRDYRIQIGRREMRRDTAGLHSGNWLVGPNGGAMDRWWGGGAIAYSVRASWWLCRRCSLR